MKLGVVGLPNVGKSTLFNALTRSGADVANYPFCTIEPNTGIVAVPDGRLDYLEKMHAPKKVTPAIVEFVDIAGLVKGASRGEGLGNQFLSHIREVDAIIHVVRAFEDSNITHVDGRINPASDIDTINTELILADLDTMEKRVARSEKATKSGDAKAKEEAMLAQMMRDHLGSGRPAASAELTPEQREIVSGWFLLTDKPVLYAANIDEDTLMSDYDSHPHIMSVRKRAENDHAGMLVVCAKIEAEISQLPDDEKAAFLTELGIMRSGLDQLIVESYALLGLISYLTAGPKEVRAWTIKKGTKAPQAAGKIHTDFEKGFIRAEVVAFDALEREGSMAACKEKGLVRSEGKDYIMKDGDVVLFRFNV